MGHPVISLTRGRRLSQLFQILDLCFNKSRYTSIKVNSDVLEMKIYNTTFVEGIIEVIVINSEVSTVTFEHNQFIRNKARVIYFWPIELPSNLTISNSNFDSNTYELSESSIVLSYLHQVTITGCSFTGHSPKGVALLQFIDFVNVINSTFSYNKAQVGGALRIIGSFQSSVVLYGTKFSVNLALISGGAVYIDGNFETHIENSIFLKNTASSEDGGALLILNVANETSITRCVFKLNEATLEGGAVYIDTLGSITFSMCNFTNNTASRVGGAVKSLNGRLSVFKNQFINNAAYSGGGLQVSTAIIEVINTIWINNTATSGGHGGAILALGNLTIRSCNFLSNQANSGGALWKIKETTYILHTNFTKNIAGIEGGGAIFHGKIGTIILQTCSFNYNSALEGKGGALQGYATELKGYNTTMIGNEAHQGGALYIIVELMHFHCSNFSNNYARLSGGSKKAENSSNITISHSVFGFNKAITGAALDLNKVNISVLQGSEVIENVATGYNPFAVAGGALKIVVSNIVILNTYFVKNIGQEGGALVIKNASTAFIANCSFINNQGEKRGGAISITQDKIDIHINQTLFVKNSADNGGAGSFEYISEPHKNYFDFRNINSSLIGCFSSFIHNFESIAECLSNLNAHNSIAIINCSFSFNNVSDPRRQGRCNFTRTEIR